LALVLLSGGCAVKQKAEPESLRAVEVQVAPLVMPTERPRGTEPPPEPEAEAFAPVTREDDAPAIEAELLRLINGERENNGLEPLGLEDAMHFAARIRAEEALTSLSHTRPDETPYHTALSEAGFPYVGKWHGENLAILIVTEPDYSPEQVAAALFQEYVASPGHHSNILSEHFVQTGVGVYRSQDGDTIQFGAAQVFAGL
jgi:uncharacterized protein YkwD